jgi:hypothetical protein
MYRARSIGAKDPIRRPSFDSFVGHLTSRTDRGRRGRVQLPVGDGHAGTSSQCCGAQLGARVGRRFQRRIICADKLRTVNQRIAVAC